MNFPKQVRIVEVGPRDGLQNEKIIIPTALKIEFVNRLSTTGLQAIEVTSFVSQKRIPQLSDGTEVFQGIQKNPEISYSALVPNARGMEAALASGVKQIAVFIAGSETFSEKNIHCSIADSLERVKEVTSFAKEYKVAVRGYISCVLGCPYEGDIPVSRIAALTNQLVELGCTEISLGDTIGVGTPLKAQKLIATIVKDIPIKHLAVHFHDTYGQALANIYACLELGVTNIDSSVAGLGGCPYAKGASGNVATEDVVYLLNGMGIQTGVNLDSLLNVSRFITKVTGQPPRSKVALAHLTQGDI